ncbi:metallophosphoesterase family protein [Chondromyces apiculatus]|uniref:Diadenosine tetraphosphatase n=1 Tax=Chondromyces apiculatus DSM 436 TaxID=1192034 RepID=A0A017SXV2_9BACT|nr:metallophosphoesterase family protein [Chondromyces apiculatus]EYF01562.1 Diadenosine tetraphosphatase [Chondromyces apiculatus DSM 436]
MRLLCVSDIQGHADALAAVLATAERRGYNHLLVAGDLCFPGPKPLETWQRLQQVKAVCTQGASDRALSTLDLAKVQPRSDHERERLDRVRQVRADLGDLIVARIARLPPIHRMPLPNGQELILVHGSPADPLEPFTHDMTDQEILALIGDDPADVILCGGSHVPFDRTVADVRIINVGSVGDAPSGLPEDPETPGAPLLWARHADAVFIELVEGRLEAEFFTVPLGKPTPLASALSTTLPRA